MFVGSLLVSCGSVVICYFVFVVICCDVFMFVDVVFCGVCFCDVFDLCMLLPFEYVSCCFRFDTICHGCSNACYCFSVS